MLRLPDPAHPGRLLPFQPSLKVYRALCDGDQRSLALNISNVADLNEATRILGQIGQSGDVVLFENDLPDNYSEN